MDKSTAPLEKKISEYARSYGQNYRQLTCFSAAYNR